MKLNKFRIKLLEKELQEVRNSNRELIEKALEVVQAQHARAFEVITSRLASLEKQVFEMKGRS